MGVPSSLNGHGGVAGHPGTSAASQWISMTDDDTNRDDDQILPLADLTVVDLTIARAGPTAVRQLADWGAEVIRIEPPGAATGAQTTPDYLNIHRNKRSLALDLKTDAGRGILHRIVEQADVLVENMRPNVKFSLGFDWETVSALNSRLVMGSISGFGQTGPYAERGGVDQIAQGMAGMMSVTGLPSQGPVRAGAAVSDIAAGLQLAIGVLVALHERERTGVGRWVHTSLLESMIGVLDFQAARWTVERDLPPQAGNDHPTLRPMGLYATADGYVNVAAAWGQLWNAFCEVIGRPDLPADARFASASGRVTHHAELSEIITDALRQRPTSHWVQALNDAGVPAGPVNDLEQVFDDPQVRHLGVAASVTHPVAGEIEIIRNATTVTGVPDTIRRPSPMAGEHTEEILQQFGYDSGDIDQLRADGVVADANPNNTPPAGRTP
jgi:crotonobetainyl-CoA:carnitine CoA-transferase CaiB-like acyl-CoA transferase